MLFSEVKLIDFTNKLLSSHAYTHHKVNYQVSSFNIIKLTLLFHVAFDEHF